MAQLLQMKAQGRWRDVERGGDLARGQTTRTLLNQQPINREPGVLGESSQGADRIFRFHISMILEILVCVKPSVH